MANNYTKILELANKNNMGLSNTIKRDYGIPLDYSSVQESYEAALTYAQTSTLAYIGQPISVGDTLYVVTDEANGYLKAVGTKPIGDNESITVAEDGTISIKGFTAAGNTQLPRAKVTVGSDGKETRTLEWVPIDAIVQGDGNTKAVVEAVENSAITVTPVYDEESDTYTYQLDVTLQAIPEVPEYSITKETGASNVTYKLTKDGTAEGESIVVPNAYDDSILDSRVTALEGTADDHEDRIADIELFFKDASKDEGSGENLKNALDTLKEIQDYITADGAAGATMVADIQANTAAIEKLNGTDATAGSVKKIVKDAIATQAAADAANYATQAALEAVKSTADAAAVKTVVDTALEGKADKTALNEYYTKDQTYDKDSIDELIAGVSTGTGETVGQVDEKLTAHISTSDAKFESIEAKDEAQDSLIQKNTDDIAAINHETTGILAKAKAAAAEDAQTKVNALATGAVAENAAAILAVDNKVTNTNTNVANLTNRVGALEQADTNITNDLSALSGAHSTLSGTVSGHTTKIKALEDKDLELDAAITANTNKFNDYSTTAVVDKKIEDAIKAIDYKDFTESIAANTKAISDEVTRADTEEKRLAGLISANTSSIQDNASEIARVEGVLNAIIENDDGTALNSIKELADWITNHDGANGVLETVNANKAAIEKLNGDGEGSVQKTVADAIASIPIATATVAGIVRASTDIEVDDKGVMSISETAFSTDRIVQGNKTLILNGGNASASKVLA